MNNGGLSSGVGASTWGIWRVDPGPRGVRLNEYPRLAAAGGVARAGWQFDREDWWLEEHGLIMEKPDFPLPAGRNELAWLNHDAASRGRESAVLTVHPDGDG